MRRALTALPVVALLTGGLVGLLPAPQVAASDATTVWQLITRSCTSNETQVGQACFDGAGHANDYDSISDSAAQGKNNGEVNNYTYDVPETISLATSNHVDLGAMVSQVSDGGAHSRLCVSGDFAHSDNGEPCATTAEAPNGQSASASHTVALLPNQALSGVIEKLTIGFEEPGGYLNYAYIASNPKEQVDFAFSMDQKITDHGKPAHVTLSSSGQFNVTPPLGANMQSSAEKGSAVFRVTRGNGATHTAHLEFVRAVYTDPHRADLHYRVVKSTLNCLPVGHRTEIDAKHHKWIDIEDLCALSGRVDVGEHDLKVTVTSS